MFSCESKSTLFGLPKEDATRNEWLSCIYSTVPEQFSPNIGVCAVCNGCMPVHLHYAFIQSDLQCIQAIHFFISMCAPWELNPQPFALQTQCSTTEPQETLPSKGCV